MPLDATALQDRLTALADKHRVVGTSLAVALGDQTVTAASGVLNVRTGQPATPDSVFQFGSITKTWTATLVLQLVDDGLLDLDAPVASYLPGFRVSDPEITAQVTARHLLTHTSGISGDFFPDNGRGDDCLERYVAELAEPTSSHALGAVMSYCNAGFSVLGRIVEVLRGATWDTVLRERLLQPLGLEAAGTLPEQALLWGAATGHLLTPDPVVAPQWGLSRSAGPAGLLHGQATDLIAFARLHLAGGVTADGTRLLSEESARAMRTPQVDVPDRWTLGRSVGLAFLLNDWGQPVFGHDGSTLGQNAFLRVIDAEEPLTVALLTNGGGAMDLFADLVEELAAEHTDARMPPRLGPPVEPFAFDPQEYVGTYGRESMVYDVVAEGEGLSLVARPSGVLATSLGTDRLTCPLIAVGPDTFVTKLPGLTGWMAAVFLTLPDGTRFLHLGGRATPRV